MNQVSILSVISSKITNWNPRTEASNEIIKYIDISSIDRIEKRIIGTSSFVGKDAPSRARQKLKSNDVLVSTVRPNLNAVAFVSNEYDNTTGSTGFCVLRCNPEKLNPRYLFHWVQTPFFVRKMMLLATGANYPAVSDMDIKDSKIPLPPLEEQKRIAAILDKADQLRQQRQRAIDRLDDLLQSVFLDMFGDPVTNPMGWPVKELGEVSRIVRGSSPRPKGDLRYYGGNIPRLMVADLTRDGFFVTPKIDSLTEEGANLSRPVPHGTVVMAVSGNVGLTAILEVDACIHDGFIGFTNLDESIYHPYYLALALNLLKKTHQTRMAGAIFKNLTTKDIKEMTIPCPPLGQQDMWIRIFEETYHMKDSFEKSYKKISDTFSSLQQRTFRGEL